MRDGFHRRPAEKLGKCAINVRGVPEDLRREFAVLCAARGQSMTSRLIELIEADISEHGEVAPVGVALRLLQLERAGEDG